MALEQAHLLMYRLQLGIGSGGARPVVMHPKLRGPVRCQNCGDVEDLQPAPLPGNHVLNLPGALNLLHVEQLPRFICLRDPSCFRCVREMYERTGLAAPAGSRGDTPLHHAARCGNLRTLYHLIVLLRDDGVVHHGRVVDAVTMRNDNGETALHMAVRVSSIEIVELLMWVHPRLGDIICANISPMYLAVSLGHRGIAQALYQGSRSPTPTNISYSGPNKQNALHAAAFLKFGGMTQMILSWNNNDLAKDADEKGRRPLHFAVSVPQRQFMRIFCFYFPRGEAGSVRRLLEADSSVAYQKDNEGLFPVHVAAMSNQWSSIHTMLKHCPGCIDLRDNQGRTFLHAAVQNNAVGVVRYACRRPEFEPILNIQDNYGNTALHLAVDFQNLWVFCILLSKRKVLLNIRSKEGETALDVAKRRIRKGFFFRGNTDKLIYRTLNRVGAKHGCSLWDKLSEQPDMCRPGNGLPELAEGTHAEDLEKEESAKVADSTRTLGIGSVLITSVTFAAAIARVPGGSGSSFSGNQAVSWQFDAFMVANALAFIFAASATVGLMYSGMAMVRLRFRQWHFKISLMFASYSVTCLTAAFALGVYMVLSPHALGPAITIFVFCSLVVIYRKAQNLFNQFLISGALCARLGFFSWLSETIGSILLLMLRDLWPFAIIFACAAYSGNGQHS